MNQNGHYGDITIDVSGAPYETGFKFNTLPFGGMTIDAGNAVRLSSATDIKLVPPEAKCIFIGTTGTRPESASPSAALRGAFFLQQGGAGVADKLYVCLKTTAQNPDTYTWVQIATG